MCQLHSRLQFGRYLPGGACKTCIHMETAVGSKSIAAAMVPESLIVYLIRLATDSVIGIEEIEAAQCLLGFILEGLRRF